MNLNWNKTDTREQLKPEEDILHDHVGRVEDKLNAVLARINQLEQKIESKGLSQDDFAKLQDKLDYERKVYREVERELGEARSKYFFYMEGKQQKEVQIAYSRYLVRLQDDHDLAKRNFELAKATKQRAEDALVQAGQEFQRSLAALQTAKQQQPAYPQDIRTQVERQLNDRHINRNTLVTHHGPNIY